MSVYRAKRPPAWQQFRESNLTARPRCGMRAAVLQLLVVVVILLAAPRATHAQLSFDAELKLHTSRTPVAPQTYWYGYQLLITDGIAVALLIGSAVTLDSCIFDSAPCHNSASELLAISGIVLYGLAAPVIHGVRGHGGKAGLSFALRATPVVFASALAVANVHAWPAVALSGALLAMVFDCAFIAREEIPPPKPKRWWFNLVPALDARRRGGMLVLADRF